MLDLLSINNLKKQKEDLEKNIQKLEAEDEMLENKKKELTETVSTLSDKLESMTKMKKELENQLLKRENFFIETELKYIDTLSGLEFESYCCDLLQKAGYVATVTKASQDSGGDIIANKDNESYIIQCKNYSEPVGNKAIQEVYAAKGIYNCNNAIVMTNSDFTAQARKEATILKIILWDRMYLKTLISLAYHFSISMLDLNNYDTRIEETADDVGDGEDSFLNEAIKLVVETGQVSTSFLQRKFLIGYARAGRIIDQMEERGIISEYNGKKPREVLWTIEELSEINKLEN